MEDFTEEFINKVRWQKAKKTHDHEYTVKAWSPGLESKFVRFVTYIYRKGFKEKFYGTYYTYLTVGKYTYWTMGDAPEVENLINRRLE